MAPSIRTARAAAVLVSLLSSLAALPVAQAEETKKSAAAAGTGNETTRAVMDSIFAPLSVVLPLSFKGDEFTSTKNRPMVQKELDRMAANASALAQHASTRDRAFEFVAKSLERDIRAVNRWYGRGQYDEARFTLHNMTENCIACHSNLPATKKFPPAESFFKAVDLKTLPPIERAELLVVSRQFEGALDAFEELFRSKEIHPMNLVVLGAFSDYLKVAINVLGDFKRPQATLKAMHDKPTTPLHVQQQLDRWTAALKDFEAKNVLAQPTLENARAALTEGKTLQEFPRDRDGLIHYVVASALALRYIQAHPDRGHGVAEAYYLLGQAEELTEHSFWITRSDFFLESAIRLDPAASFAPKAYALLEQSMITGFSGSGGENLPDDVRSLLFELRQIIKEARTGKG
jgi:hypothetical protein